MKLEFQKWMETQGFSTDAKALFDEAIICYRVGAFRSAYLMSYVGFLIVIKERVLSSEKPSFITEVQWENEVLKGLRNDDKWEEETMNLLNKRSNQSRSKYFLVNTHLLEDIDYFRRRRNDCAHAKNTKIDHSHVEVLWNFLQSHLSNFVINGGREGLLSKIEKHYDPHYTRPKADPTYLIEDISSVVDKNDIPNFLEEVAKKYVDFTHPFVENDDPEIEFWKKIAYHQNPNLREGLGNFLLRDDTKFAVFMHYFPDKINNFDRDLPTVRSVWKDALFSFLTSYSSDYWSLPVTLLRNGFIQEEEKDEFLYKLAKKVDRHNIPAYQHIIELDRHGFFIYMTYRVINDIFKGGRATYINVNNNSDAIMFGLKNVALNKEIVELLNSYFNGGYKFGAFKGELEEYMKEDPVFLKQFRKIAEEEGLILHPFFDGVE